MFVPALLPIPTMSTISSFHGRQFFFTPVDCSGVDDFPKSLLFSGSLMSVIENLWSREKHKNADGLSRQEWESEEEKYSPHDFAAEEREGVLGIQPIFSTYIVHKIELHGLASTNIAVLV